MSILVVDDSETQRNAMADLLREQGHDDVILAASAASALEILNRVRDIDLILLDIIMPDIDGIEACRRIKRRSSLRDIPVIMITSSDETADLTAAFEAGAMDYLIKPPTPVELAVRINSALKLKHERDRRKARENELLDLTRQLAEANSMLRRLAVIDPLTEVANRRYFDQAMVQEWRRSRREGRPLGLIMIDIDFFKNYNDAYGHQAGDECLVKVAKALSGCLSRPGDFVARYGGEEFAGVMPNTDLAGAMAVAERMREAVAEMAILHPDSSAAAHVTVSLGVASLIADARTTFQALIKAADQALYRAKETGRNRVST